MLQERPPRDLHIPPPQQLHIVSLLPQVTLCNRPWLFYFYPVGSQWQTHWKVKGGSQEGLPLVSALTKMSTGTSQMYMYIRFQSQQENKLLLCDAI